MPLFLGEYEFTETIDDFGYIRKIMRRFKDIEVGLIIFSMKLDDDFENEPGLVEITTKIGMFKNGWTVGYRLKTKVQKGRLCIMEGLKRFAEVKVIPIENGLPIKDVQDSGRRIMNCW